MSATAVFVDFGAVMRVGVDAFDLGAELFEKRTADDASGAVGAVEAKMKAREICRLDVI